MGDNLWILAQNFPMICTQPRPQTIKLIDKSTYFIDKKSLMIPKGKLEAENQRTYNTMTKRRTYNTMTKWQNDNDLQITTQKTKDWVTGTPIETGMDSE